MDGTAHHRGELLLTQAALLEKPREELRAAVGALVGTSGHARNGKRQHLNVKRQALALASLTTSPEKLRVAGSRSFTPEENAKIRAAATELRKRFKSQQAFADALNEPNHVITQPALSHYLKGRHDAGPPLARAIARLLGLTLDEFLGGGQLRPITLSNAELAAEFAIREGMREDVVREAIRTAPLAPDAAPSRWVQHVGMFAASRAAAPVPLPGAATEPPATVFVEVPRQGSRLGERLAFAVSLSGKPRQIIADLGIDPSSEWGNPERIARASDALGVEANWLKAGTGPVVSVSRAIAPAIRPPTFAARLRLARELRDFGVKRLTDRAQVSVKPLEGGTGRVDGDALARLVDALNVSADWLGAPEGTRRRRAAPAAEPERRKRAGGAA